MSNTRHGVIAALDVGTSKACCFIARAAGERGLEIVGVGHRLSRGVRSGAIVDMEAARSSIVAAVQAAEDMAGETIREVTVGVSCGRPASITFGVEVAIAGHEVSQGDVRKVLEQGRQHRNGDDRQLLHSIPVGFSIDGSGGIRDPQGMFGERLGVNMHVITAGAGPLRNLAACVSGCHLDAEAFVVAPYASGLAALVEDETQLGVTLLELGGGTTSLAVFAEGENVYTDTIPVGGVHVTNDIAHGLSTPRVHAERMKTLYGSAIASAADDRCVIDVPLIGEDAHTHSNHVSRSLLNGIIQPRLEEIFEMIRARLEAAGFANNPSRRVVLTRGASQMQGVRELAARVLDRQVRIGRPLGFKGLAEAAAGPAFATCAGLLAYAASKQAGRTRRSAGATGEPRGIFGRVGSWLHENF